MSGGVPGLLLFNEKGKDMATIPAPAAPAAPKTTKIIYVSPTGVDTNTGLTPDKPWRTPKGITSGTKMLLAPGEYPDCGINLSGLTDVIVDACNLVPSGNAITLPWLVTGDGGNLFSFNAKTARVLIGRVKCDSNYDQAKTAGGLCYHAAKGCFGNVRGVDISIVGPQLANLAEGIALAEASRILVQAVTQVEPMGMAARCLMIDNATDLLVNACSFINSINESPLRATGDGVTRGAFTNNTISQLLDAAHGRALAKAAVTIRQGLYVSWRYNNVINGELSFNTDITGRQTIDQSEVIGGNVTGSHLTMRPGCHNFLINGLAVTNGPSECVSDSAGLAGIIYQDLQLTGADCGIKFYADSNAQVVGLKWKPTKAGLPAMKPASGVSMAKVVQK